MKLNNFESKLLEKIKSKGYWKIESRPEYYNPEKFSLKQCKEIVQDCQVKIRGWYYPHIGSKTEEFFVGENYAEGWCDREKHREIWRFYQSGQFVHYVSLWEEDMKEFEGEKVLEPSMMYNTLFEICQFLSNLEGNYMFKETTYLSIKLFDTFQRRLKSISSLRDMDFHGDYQCMIDSISIDETLWEDRIGIGSTILPGEFAEKIIEKFNCHEDVKPHIEKWKNESCSRLG